LVLPPPEGPLTAVLRSFEEAANGRPMVFVYQGAPLARPLGRLFEMVDPYLEDKPAQVAFSQAEALGRRLGVPRRFVYVPAEVGPRGVPSVWSEVQPGETIVAPEQADLLGGIPVDYLRREGTDPAAIRHYFKRWPGS
jgi:nucleotide-binding universal stress UspA family protein